MNDMLFAWTNNVLIIIKFFSLIEKLNSENFNLKTQITIYFH
jgi:hypothetical protein